MGRFYSAGDDPDNVWVRGSDSIHHRGNTSWRAAPVPCRWHRCIPWSTHYNSVGLVDVERCACGALRLDGHGPWIYRNARRRNLDV
jgi:hypothetical protein